MLRILSAIILLSAFMVLRPSDVLAASVDGVHPYDRPERIVRGGTANRNTGTWGYKAIHDYEYSPYRTTTHMLHPYFRSQPNKRYLRRTNRLHPYITVSGWEQYQYGGWAY